MFGLIEDFHKWVDWSPWERIDPNLQRTYSGPRSGVGASYAWTGSRKVGAGRMTITAAAPDSGIVVDLEFLKPFKARNVTEFTFDEDGDSTTVTWAMTGPRTLMTKVMGVFMSMDKVVGRDFETGLAQLKAVAEN